MELGAGPHSAVSPCSFRCQPPAVPCSVLQGAREDLTAEAYPIHPHMPVTTPADPPTSPGNLGGVEKTSQSAKYGSICIPACPKQSVLLSMGRV